MPLNDQNQHPAAASSPDDEPVCNIASAMARLGGEASGRRLLADLMRFFLEDAPTYIASLERASAEGDTRMAGRMAHKIKGQIVYFDAHPTQRVAQEVEKMAAAGDTAGAIQATQRLKAEIERLTAALIPLLASENEIA